MSDPVEQQIRQAQRAYFEARDHLHDVMFTVCGDHHKPVQHRDMRSAWCHNCGRTALGQKVKEVTR